MSVASFLTATGVDPAPASAATARAPAIHDCDTYEAARGRNTFSVDFNFAAQLQHWVVPPNVAGGSVCIDVSGGQGGAGSHSPGGLGGAVNELFAVRPGQTYTISTGAIGANSASTGGAGGGGTYVFDAAHHLILASGGGGGGGSAPSSAGGAGNTLGTDHTSGSGAPGQPGGNGGGGGAP